MTDDLDRLPPMTFTLDRGRLDMRFTAKGKEYGLAAGPLFSYDDAASAIRRLLVSARATLRHAGEEEP